MRTLGNIFWLIICGWLFALLWLIFGLLWCITVVGIPVGLQCFKCARLMLWPFGYTVVYSPGTFSFIVNILWLIFGGLEIAISCIITGAVLCVSIIGIPFGIQCFKLSKLALLPFGAHVEAKCN